MATNPIGPARTGELDADEPGQDRLILLSTQRAPAAPDREARRFRASAPAMIHRLGFQFTPTDLAILAAWVLEIGHGYARLETERGVLEDGTWTTYALVYPPGQAWSTWGVMRRDGQVEVWCCASGQTVGRHARMVEALNSLPPVADRGRALPVASGRAARRSGSRRHGTRWTGVRLNG